MHSRPALAELLAYNIAVLEQAMPLIRAYRGRDSEFAACVGPHLRHVIEHYAALFDGPPDNMIDYDHRARDHVTETHADVALTCLQRCIEQLQRLAGRSAAEPVAVGFSIGLAGGEFSISHSTLGRELQFVASHAIHHYAVIKPLLLRDGITPPEDFGKAPDTVRHERLRAAT